MKLLEDIQKHLSSGHFDFSRHAFKKTIERNISESEIKEAARETKILEEYPDDKYPPPAVYF